MGKLINIFQKGRRHDAPQSGRTFGMKQSRPLRSRGSAKQGSIALKLKGEIAIHAMRGSKERVLGERVDRVRNCKKKREKR
jgi:hypothetical protein